MSISHHTSLNAKLYENELFKEWSNKNHLLHAEDYLISKYLTDKDKNILEAGTGGGRLSFFIEKKGFKNITAFDIVPSMVEHAKSTSKKMGANIAFNVADAANLTEYKNDDYDYLIYLQQVLNFIPEEEQFLSSLKESYRIAKKGSIVLFSFLDYDSRVYNKPLNLVMTILRKIRNEDRMDQRLPWIKINNKFNRKIFNKNQAVTFWVKKNKIISDLKSVGYNILEVKNASQINNNTEKRKGMLYVVCEK